MWLSLQQETARVPMTLSFIPMTVVWVIGAAGCSETECHVDLDYGSPGTSRNTILLAFPSYLFIHSLNQQRKPVPDSQSCNFWYPPTNDQGLPIHPAF